MKLFRLTGYHFGEKTEKSRCLKRFVKWQTFLLYFFYTFEYRPHVNFFEFSLGFFLKKYTLHWAERPLTLLLLWTVCTKQSLQTRTIKFLFLTVWGLTCISMARLTVTVYCAWLLPGVQGRCFKFLTVFDSLNSTRVNKVNVWILHTQCALQMLVDIVVNNWGFMLFAVLNMHEKPVFLS